MFSEKILFANFILRIRVSVICETKIHDAVSCIVIFISMFVLWSDVSASNGVSELVSNDAGRNLSRKMPNSNTSSKFHFGQFRRSCGIHCEQNYFQTPSKMLFVPFGRARGPYGGKCFFNLLIKANLSSNWYNFLNSCCCFLFILYAVKNSCFTFL